MTLCTFYTIVCGSSEYTKNTRSCTRTWTGHYRRLYNQYRSLPTTLYRSHTIMCEASEYTKNTQSCTMTGTGHYRRLYNQYRSLPTTLYTFYTIICESSEYTKNTRSCTMTWTGHDRWLYKRLTLLLGLRSTNVGIWYNTHGRALPTVRILVPSSRRVSVWPNTIAQSVPYVIYFTTTQINPGFYIYTHERSICLIANIIINIRYTPQGLMGLCP